MATTYSSGSLARLSATFRDEAGDPADPTSVTLSIKRPDGELLEIESDDLISTDIGVYSYLLEITDHEGAWYYRFVGTGSVQVVGEGSLFVKASRTL